MAVYGEYIGTRVDIGHFRIYTDVVRRIRCDERADSGCSGSTLFVGGIWVDSDSQTSMERLFAAEDERNGVHGANRLASNLTLESLVRKRAAQKIGREKRIPPQKQAERTKKG